jgi:hypothetical protein
VRGGKYTYLDPLRGSILNTIVRVEKLDHLFHGGGIHRISIGDTLMRNWRDPDESADESSVDLESHASDCSLQCEAALCILNHFHVAIKSLTSLGYTGHEQL